MPIQPGLISQGARTGAQMVATGLPEKLAKFMEIAKRQEGTERTALIGTGYTPKEAPSDMKAPPTIAEARQTVQEAGKPGPGETVTVRTPTGAVQAVGPKQVSDTDLLKIATNAVAGLYGIEDPETQGPMIGAIMQALREQLTLTKPTPATAPEAQGTPPQKAVAGNEPTVVATGKDPKTGRRVVKMSDGTIRYADEV